MSAEFQRGVQELFDTFEKLRKAEAAGNEAETRLSLADGLEQSCKLLHYLLSSDSLLHYAHPRPEPWQYFRQLVKDGTIEDFLNVERHMLKVAGLSSSLVELIVVNLRHVVEVMIERRGRLDTAWTLTLTRLADSVCDLRPTPAAHAASRRSFKRAILATAGGLVVGLNVFAAQNPKVLWLQSLPTIPNVFQLSQDAGNFLIHWSAEGALDDWAEHKASN